LSNTNESANIPILQKNLEVNKAEQTQSRRPNYLTCEVKNLTCIVKAYKLFTHFFSVALTMEHMMMLFALAFFFAVMVHSDGRSHRLTLV